MFSVVEPNNMKKFLYILALLIPMNNSIAEVTNGNLTSSWSYNSSTEQIEIEAYEI